MEIKTNIGEMDQLVLVQSCRIGRGDKGQKTYAWANHSKVWAKVERVADEVINNGNLEAGQSLTVTMYKITGMSTRWRLVIGGKNYEVTGIDPISRFSPLCQVSLTSIE